MRIRRALVTVLYVAATLSASSACTGTTPSAAPAASDPAPPVSTADENLLRRAESLLVSRCMGAHGFLFAADTAPGTPPADFPFGITDTGWAREHGFTQPSQVGVKDRQAGSPNVRYFDALPKARQQAFMTALYGG